MTIGQSCKAYLSKPKGDKCTAYDLAGNVTTETDATSKATTHTYDARGARLTSTDRNGFATTYTYDANGNELTMTDAQSQVTTYTYDNANRRTQTTWPDHTSGSSSGQTGYGITEVAYDALGRSLRKTDQLGDTITFLYDLAGRMTQRDYRTKANSPSGTIADSDTFTYDAASRILTAVKGRYSNTVTMTYDQGGRLASEGLTANGQTYTTSVAYGTTNPTLTITYPDTNVVTKTFNSRGLLSTIVRGSTTMLTKNYTNAGRLSSQTFGNGVTETVTYDTEGLPASIAAPWGTASYTYDANDNRTAESITGLLSAASWNTGSSGFDFDDRLVTRNQTGNNEAWTLSQVGNWNTYTLNGTGTNRTHGAAHEVATVGSNSVMHDSRGNITQSETGKKYAWDFDGHMSSSDGDGNNTADVTYAYDALGRRVSRTAGGTTLIFCSLRHDLIAEYTAGSAPGSPQRTYTFGQRIDDPITMHAGANTYYYHADANTSIRALTTTAGALTETYKYTAYGQPTLLAANGTTVLTSSSMSNRLLFTAREWDDALTATANQQTGTYHFRARPYGPTLGRFYSRDPLTYVDGGSLYRAYFVPRGVDPSGLQGTGIAGTVGWREPKPQSQRPKSCIFTMDSYNPQDTDRWNIEGGILQEALGAAYYRRAHHRQSILNRIRQNKCCDARFVGHRGGPTNPGGIVTYPIVGDHDTTIRILPDTAFEQELKAAFAANGCSSCDIYIYACGENDPKSGVVQSAMAASTGCTVHGAKPRLPSDLFITIGQCPGQKWYTLDPDGTTGDFPDASTCDGTVPLVPHHPPPMGGLRPPELMQ